MKGSKMDDVISTVARRLILLSKLLGMEVRVSHARPGRA